MVAIRLTTEGQQRVDKLRKENKCLGVGCECSLNGKEQIRGLCNACYQAMRRAIDKGHADEKALIRTGKLLPRANKGRPLSNPFAKDLAGE